MFSCSSPWMICEMRPFQKYTFVDHGARFLSTYFNTHSNKFVVASFHAINGCVTTWRSRCPSETSRIPFHSCSIYMVFSRYRPQLAFVRYPWPQLGFSLRVSIKFPYAFGGTTQPSGPVCAGGCERPCLRSQKAPLMDTATLADGTFFWWNLMAKVSTNGPTNTAVRAMMWLLPSRRMECDVLRFWILSMEENIRTLYGVIITI